MAKKGNGIASIKSDEQWQVESDMHTLMRAEEIRKDPKRMARVQAMAKEKLLELASVASEGKDD